MKNDEERRDVPVPYQRAQALRRLLLGIQCIACNKKHSAS